MDKDIVHQEQNLIQGCINRMASNSFQLKKWYVAMVFLSITSSCQKDIDKCFGMYMILALTCIFWYLDGFFLKMETLYRWKYEWVIKKRICGNTEFFYDLNPYNKYMWLVEDRKTNIFRFIFSKTLIPLYIGGVLCPLISICYPNVYNFFVSLLSDVSRGGN